VLLYTAGIGVMMALTWALTRGFAATLPVVPRRTRRQALGAVPIALSGVLVGALLITVASSGRDIAGDLDAQPVQSELHCSVEDLFGVAVLGLIVAGPVLVMRRRRRIPAAEMGWQAPGRQRAVLVALALGLISTVPVLLANEKPVLTVLAGLGLAHLVFFVYHLLVGAAEELVFRGYLQQWLEGWLGTWRGWLLASVLMALAHMGQRMTVLGLDAGEAWISSLKLLPPSMLMGFVMIRTRNLAAPIIVHAFANWVQSLYRD